MRIRPSLALLAIMAAGLAQAAPATAQPQQQGAMPDWPPGMQLPRPDIVTLTMREESWVETATAKVVAQVQRVLSGDAAGEESGRSLGPLEEIAPEGEWRVTGFDRSQDASGLERWVVTAEARLPEKALAGIYDRAKEASRPGTSVSILSAAFTPTLAEREAAVTALRAEIYRRAAAESDALAEAMPDHQFRVHRVEFEPTFTPSPRPRVMTMSADRMMSAPAMAAEASDTVVAEKVELNATVMLSSAPRQMRRPGTPGGPGPRRGETEKPERR